MDDSDWLTDKVLIINKCTAKLHVFRSSSFYQIICDFKENYSLCQQKKQ